MRRVWRVRNAGRVEEAHAAYLALAARVRADGATAEVTRELQLLEVSFLRSELKLDEADRRLSELGDETSFQFQFQKGLNAIARSDYPRALDAFLRARPRDENERTATLHNRIVCLEELGLDFGRELAELTELVRDSEFYGGKLDAFRAADFYRRGELGKLAAIARRGNPEDRLYYLLAWIAAHPLYSLFSSHEREREFTRRYTEAGARWVNAYRLRTLKGLALENDFDAGVKVSEKIQRLHLWLWRWLVDPTANLLDRIVALKSDIFDSLAIAPAQTLAYESFQMLENAMRWLALFANAASIDASDAIRGINYTLGFAAVPLEYERLYLDYLFARRGDKRSVARDTRTALRDHQMHGRREFPLGAVVGGEVPEGWERFVEAIEDLFTEPPTGDALVVSAREQTVRRLRDGRPVETVLSEALTALCLALLEKESLTKAEALKTCFGIPRYDALVHAPKLANTLTRANKLMKPIIELKTRGDRVVAVKLDRARLSVVGASAHATLLSRQREPVFLGRLRAPRTISPSERALLGGFAEKWRTREEYERLLGVSKATATRRIQSWVKEKMVLKKGRGRQSRYKMLPILSEALIDGRGTT